MIVNMAFREVNHLLAVMWPRADMSFHSLIASMDHIEWISADATKCTYASGSDYRAAGS